MKLKKVMGLLIIGCAISVIITGCESSNKENKTSKKEEVVSGQLEISYDKHWYETKSGVKDEADHVLEDGVCAVCKAEIGEDDGYKWVSLSDKNGNQIRSITYEKDGKVKFDMRYEYEYDKDGCEIGRKDYEFGTLINEYKHKIKKEDGILISSYTEEVITYNEDGTKIVEKNDENAWPVKEIKYDKDGNKEYEYKIVNKFNKNDCIESIKKYDGETLIIEIKSEYDKESNILCEKTYEYGKLAKEEKYSYEDGYGYVSKEIIYKKDGTKKVTKYDEEGNKIK